MSVVVPLLLLVPLVSGICFPTCAECVNPEASNSTCDRCTAGHWDTHCTRPCDLRCDQAVGCDKQSGNCLGCPRGKAGAACDRSCPSTCLNSTCTADASGAFNCTLGCERGYYGASCGIACRPGCARANAALPVCNSDGECAQGCRQDFIASPTCSKSCPFACSDAPANATGVPVCSLVNNQTVCNHGCKPRYFNGANQLACESVCPRSCAAADQCDQSTGECSVGCDPFFFGRFCELRCPLACADGLCDRTTGACLKCSGDMGGVNCTVNCAGCDRVEGTCDARGCSKCAAGRFKKDGKNCDSLCPNCQGGVCDSLTGRCAECSAGFWGDDCRRACSQGCASLIGDVFDGPCDRATGRCSMGCNYRRTGPDCSRFCAFCVGACDQDGCAQCERGRGGRFCDISCSRCKDDTCLSNGTCAACDQGRWGRDCDSFSTALCIDTDRETGACAMCADTHWGPSCVACNFDCLSPALEAETTRRCDQRTGRCLHGCSSFASGPHCDEAAEKAELGATVIIFAVVVPVVVVVLCLVLLGIAVYQRRRPVAQQTPQ
jgi:hypothetical protein